MPSAARCAVATAVRAAIGLGQQRRARRRVLPALLYDGATVHRTMPRSSFIYSVLLCALALGCGGAEDEAGDTCSVQQQKQYVYDIMKGPYLWADETPDIDLDDYASPQEVLNAMAYREVDHWSGMQDLQTRNDYFERATFISLGDQHRFDTDGAYRVSWVYPGSPADEAGLKRSMEIIEIGGKPIAEIIEKNLWAEVRGPEEEGVIVRYKVREVDGTELELEIEKRAFQIDTVPLTRIFETSVGKVGYVIFQTFVVTSVEELAEAFKELSEQGIERLILDLRYNSGGLLAVAAYLGGLLAGHDHAGEVLVHEAYNETYRELDRYLLIGEEEYALQLKQLVVLTGFSTASASEQVINGVRPMIPVTLVGTRTFGKPVGADTFVNCDQAIVPVTFRSLNQEGIGDFYDGLAVDCLVGDDLKHELGDPEEEQLKRGLTYLEEGRCFSHDDIATLESVRTLNMEQLARPFMMDTAEMTDTTR